MSTQDVQLEVLANRLIDFGRSAVNCLNITRNEDDLMEALIGRELDPMAERLSEESHKNLIQGLVLFQRLIDKAGSGYALGGSVSPVISLWQSYVAKYPEKEADLTAWVVTHRVNEYEPFGSIVFSDCMSISSREQALTAWEEEKRRRWVIEEEKQEKAQAVKREKDRVNANRNLPNAVARGDIKAVKALLDKGGDVLIKASDGKSLLELAEQNNCEEVVGCLNQILAK